MDEHEPVHAAFGLSYASYLVWPRTLMEHMPVEWQRRFVAFADEFNATWGDYEPAGGWSVIAKDVRGKIVSDPLRNYRHPPLKLLAELRRASPPEPKAEGRP